MKEHIRFCVIAFIVFFIATIIILGITNFEINRIENENVKYINLYFDGRIDYIDSLDMDGENLKEIIRFIKRDVIKIIKGECNETNKD